LKITEKSDLKLTAEYLGYEITIFRESSSKDWYMIVITKGGTYVVDGWWNDSYTATIYDALDHALEEAALI
jgi:RES domain-containing protein